MKKSAPLGGVRFKEGEGVLLITSGTPSINSNYGSKMG